MKLTKSVASILQQANIQNDIVCFPSQRLQEEDFNGLREAMSSVGTRWNKERRGYTFRGKAEVIKRRVDALVASEVKEITVIQPLKPSGLSDKVVEALVEESDVFRSEVLNPFADDGSIADLCIAYGARSVTCIEKDEEKAAHLLRSGWVTKVSAFSGIAPEDHLLFDRVVMIPPEAWASPCITHAFDFVRHGGLITAVVPTKLLQTDAIFAPTRVRIIDDSKVVIIYER